MKKERTTAFNKRTEFQPSDTKKTPTGIGEALTAMGADLGLSEASVKHLHSLDRKNQ
jgi:hypothetical protein